MVNRGFNKYDDKNKRRQRLALRKRDKMKRQSIIAARRAQAEETIPFYKRDLDDVE